jgi:hypothetical protein
MWIDATVAGGMLEDPKESQVSGKMGYAQAPIEATPSIDLTIRRQLQ